MNFFSSIHCASRLHCKSCRANTPSGDKFRADILLKFSDVKEQNFTCPHGRAWGFIGVGDRVATITQPVARLLDRVLGTDIQNCGGCAKRKQMLNEL